MRPRLLLSITSVLTVLFMVIHLANDIVRGYERGQLLNLSFVLTATVWLYGTLVLSGRRSGYIITLLGSLLALAVPTTHMLGKGLGAPQIVTSTGASFFIFVTVAVGITALLSIVLCVQGLWTFTRERVE